MIIAEETVPIIASVFLLFSIKIPPIPNPKEIEKSVMKMIAVNPILKSFSSVKSSKFNIDTYIKTNPRIVIPTRLIIKEAIPTPEFFLTIFII